MKRLYLFLLLFVIAVAGNAQSVITIQRGTTTLLETIFDTAIAHSQNGDVIYLPGGVLASSTNIIITKKISIFGAGYREDSSAITHPTTFHGAITIATGAEGTLLSGLSSDGEFIIKCNNITVTRCRLQGDCQISGSNILIQENIIGGFYSFGAAYKNILITKNIVYGSIFSLNGGLFLNNIFLIPGTGIVLCEGVLNCSFSNNIIYTSSPYVTLIDNNSTGLSFTNNLFTQDFSPLYDMYNKVQAIGDIFVNYTSTAWDLSQNFNLKPGCIGIKAGTDGTDVGIYGTPTPFKSSTLPINPHIQSVSIPNAVGQNGSLSIHIKVAAQNQ